MGKKVGGIAVDGDCAPFAQDWLRCSAADKRNRFQSEWGSRRPVGDANKMPLEHASASHSEAATAPGCSSYFLAVAWNSNLTYQLPSGTTSKKSWMESPTW
jgi:hypothetical protein